MESNYVNVDSLWSSNNFYLLISVWKPVQLRCWIRNSCINEPRGMFLILELSLCRIVMNFPKSVFKCVIKKVVLLQQTKIDSNVYHQIFRYIWIFMAEYNFHLLIGKRKDIKFQNTSIRILQNVLAKWRLVFGLAVRMCCRTFEFPIGVPRFKSWLPFWSSFLLS